MNPTPAQSKILKFIIANPGTNVQISAVPGAGKTTLFGMLAKELKRQGIPLTVLTFSKSLAEQMGSEIDGTTSTTHAVMFQALRAHLKLNNIRPQMGKYVKDDMLSFETHRMLKREYGIDGIIPDELRKEFYSRQFSAITLANKIRSQALDYAKDQEEIQKRFLEKFGTGTISDALTILSVLSDRFKQRAQFDFLGMLYLPFIHEEVQKQIVSPRVLGIDEANDSFPILREAYKIISRESETVVISGDERQTIHIWAGTEPNTMDIMRAAWDATVMSYSQTFRVPNVMCDYLNVSEIDTRIRPFQYREGEINSISYNQMLLDVQSGDAIIGRWNVGKRKNTLEAISLDLLRLGKKVALVGSSYLEDIDELLGMTVIPNSYRIKDDGLLNAVKREVAELITLERTSKSMSDDMDNWKITQLERKFRTFALYLDFYQKFNAEPHTAEGFKAFTVGLYSTAEDAIQLISAHRSKGKEYRKVYGIHINEIVGDVENQELSLDERIEAHNLLLVMLTRSSFSFSSVDAELPEHLPPPTAKVETKFHLCERRESVG